MRLLQNVAQTAALVMLVILTAGSAWGQSIQLSPADQTIGWNDNVTYDVTITNVTQLQASHFELTFDNTKLEYVSASNGSVFDGDAFFKQLLTTSGTTSKLTIDQAVAGGSPVGGTGTLTLATIVLKGIDGVSGSALGLTSSLRRPDNTIIVAPPAGGTVTVNNASPVITGIDPISKTVEDDPFLLTVTGSSFTASSVVNVDGVPLATTYVSSTELRVSNVSAGTVAGTIPVTVVNPAPGGGISGAFFITVLPGTPTTVQVETAADGSGTIAPVQSIASGMTLTVYAITRTVGGIFVENVSADAWALENVTGTVVSGDLVPAGDGKSAVFTAHGIGTATIKATSGALTTTSSGTITVTPGTPAKLAFAQQPTTAVAGVIISPPITARIEDAAGNLVTEETRPIHIQIENNPGSGILNGTQDVNAVGGIATFNDIRTETAGIGYTLKVSDTADPPLTVAISDAFDILPTSVNHFNFNTIPNQVTDVPFSVTITAIDNFGNIATGFAGTGTFSASAGSIAPVTSNAFVAGVLTQSVTVTGIAAGVTIGINDGSSHTGTSNPFNVTTGVATKILVETAADGSGTVVPAQSLVSGGTVTVYAVARDASNNFIENIAAETWSVESPSGGVVQGDLVAAPDMKSAVFTGHLIGTGSLLASKSGMTPTGSGIITVTVGEAARMTFGQNPTNAVAGVPIVPPITVRVEDAAGNLVTTDTRNVYLDFGNNPGASGLFGLNSLSAVGGIATFDNIYLDKVGVGYTLVAASTAMPALITPTSTPFDIAQGPLHGFAFNAIAAQTAGTPFSITITAIDEFGNTVPGFTGSVNLTSTAGAVTPAASGNFTAGTLTLNVTLPGFGIGRTITADDGAGHTGISGTFDVTSAPQVYLKAAALTSSSSILFPNTSWKVTGYEDNDWSFAAPALTFTIVPEPGMIFSSSAITLSWAEGEIEYSGAAAGNIAGLSFLATPGTNQVTITCSAAGDVVAAEGDYIATVSFTTLKPGHATMTIADADFTRSGIGAFAVTTHNGEVKAYLGDVASPMLPSGVDESQGDGKIDIMDLTLWSASYWSGVTGGSGMANYKVKYDVGPTTTGYVWGLPVVDAEIEFEDLVIFSIEYGLSANATLPKAAELSKEPVELSLGEPVVMGNETRIGVMVGGAVNDIRATHLALTGQFGKFLGAEKGSLLQNYATPVLVMSRSQEEQIIVDLAVAGLDAQGISTSGELVVLRFEGTPAVRLTSHEVRNSQNLTLAAIKVKGPGEATPTSYRIAQNYPNPFNPSTTIGYEIPAAGEVRLDVYNMLGERIATLVNEIQEAGYYRVQWNGRDMDQRPVASGVYFYRMQSGQFSSVMRMLLLK
ncbi:MAG: T9SS type A sorting domain-containing protein [Bacteroidetes bacterium]|nr:T9SS type A sorting domain-containing protein [Bacteroidota bacterium]